MTVGPGGCDLTHDYGNAPGTYCTWLGDGRARQVKRQLCRAPNRKVKVLLYLAHNSLQCILDCRAGEQTPTMCVYRWSGSCIYVLHICCRGLVLGCTSQVQHIPIGITYRVCSLFAAAQNTGHERSREREIGHETPSLCRCWWCPGEIVGL